MEKKYFIEALQFKRKLSGVTRILNSLAKRFFVKKDFFYKRSTLFYLCEKSNIIGYLYYIGCCCKCLWKWMLRLLPLMLLLWLWSMVPTLIISTTSPDLLCKI